MKLNTNERNIFVASDSHYSHKNLIKSLSTWDSGAHRDFKSVDEHNTILVNNINNTVGQDDILFLLGDVAFGGFDNVKIFIDRLICKEIHLVLGNHDTHIKKDRNNIQNIFASVSTRIDDLYIDSDQFILDHYPIREWENCHKGSYMLYGHQHQLPKDRFSNGPGRSMDIGLDGHFEFRPYNIKEIFSLLKNKPFGIHH